MLTGGRSGYQSWTRLRSNILYPELDNCSVPDLEVPHQTGFDGHFTFLTQESSPRIVTCAGEKCYVLQNGSWERGVIDDPPLPRAQVATARIEIGVFILGGNQGVAKSDSSIFLRANTSSWVAGPKLPVGMLRGPCAAPISAHSFLITCNADVYEFDSRVAGPTSKAGWQDKEKWPQLQQERQNWMGCGVVNRKFIVVGGIDGSMVPPVLKTTEIIDLEKRTIVFGGNMAKARFWFHILSINGTLFALGGEEERHQYLEDVEEFVEETGTWKRATSLPGKRYKYGGVSVTRDLVCG